MLNDMIELCKKAQIEIKGRVQDTRPLIEAAERSRRALAKSMGKTICKMADKRNVVEFDTDGLQDMVDEIIKRIRTIDGITKLLHKVAQREKHKVADIRRYLSHSSGDEDSAEDNDAEDSVIIEEYGSDHRDTREAKSH